MGPKPGNLRGNPELEEQRRRGPDGKPAWSVEHRWSAHFNGEAFLKTSRFFLGLYNETINNHTRFLENTSFLLVVSSCSFLVDPQKTTQPLLDAHPNGWKEDIEKEDFGKWDVALTCSCPESNVLCVWLI